MKRQCLSAEKKGDAERRDSLGKGTVNRSNSLDVIFEAAVKAQAGRQGLVAAPTGHFEVQAVFFNGPQGGTISRIRGALPHELFLPTRSCHWT